MTQTNLIARAAFIGTGLMGAPMARRLLDAGFSVRAWNRTRAKLAPIIGAGAVAAASPADAASHTDVVCLCLTDALAVESVLFGEDGVVRAVNPPPLLVDFSTIGPEATRIYAQRLRALCPTSWIDAPVSGGATGAEEGRLVIFCGGSRQDLARLDPLFAALAQRVTHVGDVGAGQTLKLCNQLIVATNMIAIAEALSLARDCGLSVEGIPDALHGGFADSLPLQIFGRRMAQGITFPVLGELGLMLKDLGAVDALAAQRRSDLPLTHAALGVYRRAEAQDMLRRDLASLISLYPPRD
jgi:3-hydroxyisobutyrate dehydrogenase-like beta-hydroxyacid dehydrogenase